MRLYHGSYCRIEKVNLDFSKPNKDFGAGFYLTPDFSRAVTMALRNVELYGGESPEVNAFIFHRNRCPQNILIKEFRTTNWEWAQFVMMNRDKTLPHFQHNYDIVIGPVADSSVDPLIRAYKAEFGASYQERQNLVILAQRLKYPGRRYIQYCFCTPAAIDLLIRD